MTVDLPVMSWLLPFVLVMARAAAFIAVAPPFSSRAIPARIKATLAFALALPVTPLIVPKVPSLDATGLVVAVAFQLASGLVMGFIVLLLTSAIQAAGELIDLMSMFAMSSMLDPISNTNSSLFGRIQQLVATTLLFTSGGHLMILRGFLTSFEATFQRAPDAGGLAGVLIENLSVFMVSALEICGPVVVVLFCADLAMGMVSRAVPSLNVFQLSFPVKTVLTVALASIAVAVLPAAVSGIVDRVIGEMAPVSGFLGG